MTNQARRVFAVGNALVALLMLALGAAIPIVHWTISLTLTAVVVSVGSSSVLVLVRPRWAERSLRVAAYVLLGLGVLAATAIVLTVAFLAGVHGQFLRHGIAQLLFCFAVVMPYLFIYPGVLLSLLARDDRVNPG